MEEQTVFATIFCSVIVILVIFLKLGKFFSKSIPKMSGHAGRTSLDPTELNKWTADKKCPKDRGGLEHAFLQTFSITEKIMSQMSPTGASMGEDAHFDARQSLTCLAKMVDSKRITRALIQLSDQSNLEAVVVDVVTYDNIKIRKLPESGDPMVLARVAYFTGDPIAMLTKSMPDSGEVQAIRCTSAEEMKILKSVFDANHERLKLEFRDQLEKKLPKNLLRIPRSFTTYFNPLYIGESETPMETCLECGKPSNRVCGKCKVARYCRRKCQRDHWSSTHKKECKSPEDQAAASANNNDAKWVDVNPQHTPEAYRFVVALGMKQSVKHGFKNAKPSDQLRIFDGIKRDKMLLVKVQIQPGSFAYQGEPILIYPQGKKFQLTCVPANTVNGQVAYNELHSTVKEYGTDAGLGMGGCKAYINGYVTDKGHLRIMVNEIKPLQKW